MEGLFHSVLVLIVHVKTKVLDLGLGRQLNVTRIWMRMVVERPKT